MGGGPLGAAPGAQRPADPRDDLLCSDSAAASRRHPLTATVSRPLHLATAGLRHVWASGIACILGAAFCFSWAAAFVKMIEQLQPEITIFLIIAIRSLLSVAASCAAARRLPLAGSAATAPLLALRGLCGACAMTLFYAALSRIPLADTLTLMFLNPAICALLGWALLGERASWRTAAGCLASLAGVACVARPPFLFGGGDDEEAEGGAGSGRLAGAGMAALSAFFAAGAYITVRTIGSREPAVTIAFAFHLASLLTSLVPLALGFPGPAVLPRLPAAACLLAVATCSFAAQLLLSRGFQLETATKASAANFTQVLWGHAIGVAVFQEPTTALGLLGAALVVAGVVAVTADKQQHQAGAGAAAAGQASKPGLAAGAELMPQGNGTLHARHRQHLGEYFSDEEAPGAGAAAAAAAVTAEAEGGEWGPLLPPRR